MTESDLSRRREQGFTLIELLVVMAITVILLGLIFGPMIQGFNLTNRARVQVLTQDAARRAMEIGQRDVANGVYVFDNSQEPINFWVTGITDPNDPTSAKVVLPVKIPYAFVDLVPPARFIDQDASVQPGDIDPTTGLPRESSAFDPNNPDSWRNNVQLPLAPGRAIVRYFVGLRDNRSDTDPSGLTNGRPLKPYANYYEDTRNQSLQDHNPLILYRAVFSPYLPNGQIDERLIDLKDEQGNPRSLTDALHDPNFFYDAHNAAGAMPGWKDMNGDGTPQYFENWRAVSRALVPTDRADEAIVERGENRQPLYVPYTINGTTYGVPRITPLVKFQPTYVGNDAGAPASTTDPGNEMPVSLVAGGIPPATNVESYGYWTFPFNIYVYRGDMGASVLRYFYWNGSGPVIYFGPENGGSGASTGFDPYSLDARYQKPYLNLMNLDTGVPQILFTVDERRGHVNFTFPEWIVWHDSQGIPVLSANAVQPLQYDPAAANARWANAAGGRYRYLSLLTYPDGNANPLFDITKLWTYDRNGNKIQSMRIVPGSETIIGPDMRPGPNYGNPVTYTRLPMTADPKSIGPNEYIINYEDRPAPANNTNPTPEELDILRAGTVIFDSYGDTTDDAVPPNVLPTTDGQGNPAYIIVTYEVQNNLFTDIVKADYLTRQLMTFSLGVRLYDLNSGQPQQVTLTQKVKVRNLLR
jgi:prepilin-type N-terminal cleavage/methylation domain-containing protein